MAGAIYYATTDSNGVLCVDQIGEEWDGFQRDDAEQSAATLAIVYPETIYFHHWAGEPSLRN